MYVTVQSLHSVFIRKYWDIILSLRVYFVLYISRSQGGGRTTAMLPSLCPDLVLSCPSRLPPLPAHLIPPLCCLAARPFKSLAHPRSLHPPVSFLRPAAQPSTFFSRSPAPLSRPVLLRRLHHSRCVPPRPACCCTVDNGREEEQEEEINRVANK